MLLLLMSAFVLVGFSSCPRSLPPFPQLRWGQCALNWPKPKEGEKPKPMLYCVNPQTGECMWTDVNGKCVPVPVDTPYAKGSQLLFPEDFKAVSDWADKVLDVAQKRCK